MAHEMSMLHCFVMCVPSSTRNADSEVEVIAPTNIHAAQCNQQLDGYMQTCRQDVPVVERASAGDVEGPSQRPETCVDFGPYPLRAPPLEHMTTKAMTNPIDT